MLPRFFPPPVPSLLRLHHSSLFHPPDPSRAPRRVIPANIIVNIDHRFGDDNATPPARDTLVFIGNFDSASNHYLVNFSFNTHKGTR